MVAIALNCYTTHVSHAEWAAFVHAAFEHERKRMACLAAEDRLAAAERHWWVTPAERAEAIASDADRRA